MTTVFCVHADKLEKPVYCDSKSSAKRVARDNALDDYTIEACYAAPFTAAGLVAYIENGGQWCIDREEIAVYKAGKRA